jgi:hypothetical protein
MSNEIATVQTQSSEVIAKLVLAGDLSKMTDDQKVSYYKQFCESLGLNPLTEPFAILKLNGKEKLYAKKDATEQLRKVHGVSINSLTTDLVAGCYKVTAEAVDASGKRDIATGVVAIEGLKGENLANAMMKAETKAKRRVTLSICGLGMLDESEVETIQDAQITTGQPGAGAKAKVEPFVVTEEMLNKANALIASSTLDDNGKAIAANTAANCTDPKQWAAIMAKLQASQPAA